MGKKLLLIGGGGHCKSILDTLYTCNAYEEIGIIEQAHISAKKVLDTDIIGTEENLPALKEAGYTDAFISVGSVGNPAVRIKLFRQLMNLCFNIPIIVDPSSYIGFNCHIGTGVFIGKNTIINAETKIGNGAIINTNAIIEHDCEIGAFVHIAPGSTICGNTYIGNHSHIGAGATVIQSVHIGKGVIVGAGSVVVGSIEDFQRYCGVPAKKM